MRADFSAFAARSERCLLPPRTRATNLHLKIARLRGLLAKSEDAARRTEMLIRESDHRIKNNLQIVANLLHLQAGRDEDASSSIALHAAAARIESIARIHDALQDSGGEDLVDIGKVLKTMCQSLHAMAGDPGAPTLLVSAESIHAPLALAQPIALAVNELVVNALRHAYPGNIVGTIRIGAVYADGEIRIVVADDGDGLPADYCEGCGFGLRLVRSMVRQISGVLRIENDAGAHFTIVAPIPATLRIVG